MGELLDRLLPELRQRFANRGMSVVEGEPRYVCFPPIHSAVGEIQIYDDGDEFTVVYGNFTHCHYGEWSASSANWKQEAIDSVLADLDALFDNRLKMWGSHTSSGGIVREDTEDQSLCDGDKHYVWSGPVDNAA